MSPATTTHVHISGNNNIGQPQFHAVTSAGNMPTSQPQIAPRPVQAVLNTQSPPQTSSPKYYQGTMNIKANVINVPTEGKAADIGYISSPNFHTKSNRVKATTAHVPVATESLKSTTSQSPRGQIAVNSPMASPASTPSPSPGLIHQAQSPGLGHYNQQITQSPGHPRGTSVSDLQQQQAMLEDAKGSPARGKKAPKKVRMMTPESGNSPSPANTGDYQQYGGGGSTIVTPSTPPQQHSGSASSDQDILSPTGQTKLKHKPPPLNVPSHVQQLPSAANSPTVASSPRKSIIKKNKDDGMDKVLQQVEFEKHFHSLPKYVPDETVSTTPLPQSPRGIINVYKQKNKISHLAKGEAQDGDPNKHSSESEAATPTPKTPKSTRHDDRRFFGENFSLDLASTGLPGSKVFDFDGDPNSPRTPKTPSSPGAFSNRRILDQRRHLVMQLFDEHGLYPTSQATVTFQNKYSEIFPNKSCLQLKIREVRQKMMASVQNTPKTPTTPSASSSSQDTQDLSSRSVSQAQLNPPPGPAMPPSSVPSPSAGQTGSSLSVPGGAPSMMGGTVRRASPLAKSPLAFNSVQ
ncbi:unnamed protein product [Lymnaea stagnalis]|uniref:Protein capicua homolog-like C-terminal tri-helical domain-containing protein n=1 Tax=Lymnaea stagnalis TaxID=6523 RepID=A0AAV2I8G3_LYMST